MTSRCAEIRRCRPLLGTFVDVSASADSAERTLRALEAAFAAIQRVQRLMSFHDAASDVSRMNRDAAQGPVEVDAWTYRVLAAARDLHAQTRGAFDVSVAPYLQRWGYLPAEPHSTPRAADQSAIDLLHGRRVSFRKPLCVDLGGIAKGFAVDRAVEALRHAGASSGVVNAGGDLRVFGATPSMVHVRHPREPSRLLPMGTLANAAVATSAVYFARRRWRGREVSPLVDPRWGRPCTQALSVSVQATTCLVADALTKVVMILGARSAEILRVYSATAMLVTPGGDVIGSEVAA